MKIKIEINMDNAAFEAFQDDRRDGCEVSRILHVLARDVDGTNVSERDSWVLMDVNGNRVGLCEVED